MTTTTRNEICDIIGRAIAELPDFDINLIGDLEDFVDSEEPDPNPDNKECFEREIAEHEAYVYAIMAVAAHAGVVDEFPFENAGDKIYELWDRYCKLNGYKNEVVKNFSYKCFNEQSADFV